MIVILLFTLVNISRHVFSDSDSKLGVHVKETKDLLKDIDEVKIAFENDSIVDNNIIEPNELPVNLNINSEIYVEDISYLNSRGKGFFCFNFNEQIGMINNTYFLDLSIDMYKEGDILYYKNGKDFYRGKLLSFDNQTHKILNYETDLVDDIEMSNIYGIYLTEEND
jgi:hypothetical protein